MNLTRVVETVMFSAWRDWRESSGGDGRSCPQAAETRPKTTSQDELSRMSPELRVRLDGVVRLDAIPVLGTRRTDYKLLRARAAERAPGTMYSWSAARNP